jgi:hypothetical protein
MKRFLLGIAAAALLAGAAFAQTNFSGAIYTSPVVVDGAIPFIAGPQSSVVQAHGGTFTANGSTGVTVSDTSVTANSVIIFGLKTVGGTINGGPFVVTVTPGTGFSIKSGSTDTSTYNYWILG